MCGLTGFIDYSRQTSRAELEAMTESLVHRGPDGGQLQIYDLERTRIGFGHRRLSVIDLSVTANQPMTFDGLSVVFNGEIYNHASIRLELEALGHRFDTTSDTEVVLHSWREWGEAAIQRWRGMFAMVLLDETKGEVVAIRDRAGVKPLFYSFHAGLFLFGSELKALRAHSRFVCSLDRSALAAFLQYGYVPAPHSIFTHTRKLLPGHLLRLDLATRELSTREYWSVYDSFNAPKLSISMPEALAETERVLTESFELRMVSDVPVGVFLSGGYDSTCVTALLQKDRTERLKTFTIGTEDPALDETSHARAVARHLGTDHTDYVCSARDALELVPTLGEIYDEPFADSSAIPTLLVSKLARRNVTVALSADGGDEIFAGYNRYDYVSRFGPRLRSIPAPLRRLAAAAMDRIPSTAIPVLRDRTNVHSRYDKAKSMLRDPSAGQMLLNLTHVFTTHEVNQLMQETVTPLRTRHVSNRLTTTDDDIARLMTADFETFLPDDVLQKVDRATMSLSLEGREPFLDQHIVEWAARLPTAMKYHHGTKKYLVREIVHRHVPRALVDRPKMGFGIPMLDWLRGPLRPLVDEQLSEQALSRHGLLRFQPIAKLVSEFYAGHSEHYVKLWHLLTFQLWHARWMQ